MNKYKRRVSGFLGRKFFLVLVNIFKMKLLSQGSTLLHGIETIILSSKRVVSWHQRARFKKLLDVMKAT